MTIAYDRDRLAHFPGIGFISRADLIPCGCCGATRYYVVAGAIRCPACLPPRDEAAILGWVDVTARKLTVRRRDLSAVDSEET